MKAGQYKIDPVVGKDDAEKTDHWEDGHSFASPAPDHTGVEHGGIDQPGD